MMCLDCGNTEAATLCTACVKTAADVGLTPNERLEQLGALPIYEEPT